jgi:hypothetical protein
LNHDLLYEEYLRSINVTPNDGFRAEKENAKVRFFDFDNFDGSSKIRLFKLHGSINWYRFKSKQNRDGHLKFGIPVSHDPTHCEDDTIELSSNTPEFLTGTFNKYAAYGLHIYADFHHWFHRLLREHNTILISGYGWGDRGINQRLFEWFLHSTKNRMVLMHKEEELPKLLASFKDTQRSSLRNLIGRGRVLKTGNWMSCTKAEEVFKLLGWSRM